MINETKIDLVLNDSKEIKKYIKFIKKCKRKDEKRRRKVLNLLYYTI